jgi:hypothetical protein
VSGVFFLSINCTDHFRSLKCGELPTPG